MKLKKRSVFNLPFLRSYISHLNANRFSHVLFKYFIYFFIKQSVISSSNDTFCGKNGVENVMVVTQFLLSPTDCRKYTSPLSLWNIILIPFRNFLCINIYFRYNIYILYFYFLGASPATTIIDSDLLSVLCQYLFPSERNIFWFENMT